MISLQLPQLSAHTLDRRTTVGNGPTPGHDVPYAAPLHSRKYRWLRTPAKPLK